ncbi:fumarate hydratase [Sphingobacterium sp. SGG-5]|uniref:fumarate hydratase n=1 Tax=Sphingobacterium sp. SGG-5 TaxID=2710881 RepID=UPI00293BFA17|nr:fumarate hydratase [Sphingobacterium sp. SGG-5]
MLFAFLSCQRHSDMQEEGAAFLQGVWQQDSIPGQEDMLRYTLHELRFTCDSMYATMYVHASVKTMPDSCFKGGQWTEYAKAVYVVRGDSMIVEGVYTKENGKQKISGCYKHGQYLPRFKIAYYSSDSLVLESRFDSRPLIMKKTADIVCVPKKRWEM